MPWEELDGGLTSAPAVSSWGVNRLDVVVRGGNDRVYHRSFAGRWNNWSTVGTSAASAPTVASWGPNRLDIFFRRPGDRLCQRYFAGAWSPAQAQICFDGATLDSAPSATSWGVNRLDVFARSNGQLLHRYFDNRWFPFETLEGELASAPAVTGFTAGTVRNLDLYAADATGDLRQKVYRSTTGYTPMQRLAPFVPAVPAVPNSPISVLQTVGSDGGPISYAFTDDDGVLRYGFHSAFGLEWRVLGTDFVGQPTMTSREDGQEEVTALQADADIRSSISGTWTDRGGWMAHPPVVERQSNGALVYFAVDGDGRLWAKRQDGPNGAYLPWADLGDIDLTGSLAVAVAPTLNEVQLFAIDRGGVLRTAAYSPAGTLGPWTALGGSGLTGVPAVTVSPGPVLRVFVRAADGTILTKGQDLLDAFPDAWTPLPGFTATGSPAALLSPITGRVEVVARGQDGYVYWATVVGRR